MNNWTKLTIEEKLTILSNVAESKGIVDNAVEKDYWVSMVLRAIFTLPYATAFVFKGGTSLSKGWSLIERFSEDIVVVLIEYDSILQNKIQYIPERVKIEISCRSLMEPSERIEIRSMIEDAYPDEEFSLSAFAVPTVVPGRTFLEKVFLLHEEFNRPNGCTRIERITRHMYDIVKMMDKPFASEAMNNKILYEDIVSHRSQFTAWSGLDYASHLPQTINFVPPTHIMTALQDDYRQMQIGFIYAEAPSFDEIMEQLQELQDSFRSLKWENNC